MSKRSKKHKNVPNGMRIKPNIEPIRKEPLRKPRRVNPESTQIQPDHKQNQKEGQINRNVVVFGRGIERQHTNMDQGNQIDEPEARVHEAFPVHIFLQMNGVSQGNEEDSKTK